MKNSNSVPNDMRGKSCAPNNGVRSSKTSLGSGSPLWALYDRLIGLIPKGIRVEDCLVGQHWTLVRSVGLGMAMTPIEGDKILTRGRVIRGMEVSCLAECITSWNPMEATIGLAAINSVVNSKSTVIHQWNCDLEKQDDDNVFMRMKKELEGKKVAVVGHFPNLETLASTCQLSILERIPQRGDLPDPACEYILPEQDYVFITAATLVNKTLPRLLQLSRDAFVILVGPSTPLTPLFFRERISQLAGTVVLDEEQIWHNVAEGGERSVLQVGARMITVTPADAKT